ncbi:MAG: sensor histidine kinase [Rhodanobacter sp.]
MIHYDKQNKTLEKLKRERSDAVVALKHAEEERSRLYSILDGIMHETRRLNSEVASACEDVSKHIANNNYVQAALDADDAFYSSGLISSRLTFADYEVNPEAITRQAKYSSGVYKKFDKARRILSRSAKRKHVAINIHGPSRNEIDVFPAFEMVPFVLLDNAIKYSPEHQEVSIDVEDNPVAGVRVEAAVTSIGPRVPASELSDIVKRGIRGSGASKSKIPGEGIGLYLADTLTRLANGRMELSSSQDGLFVLNGVEYSTFVARLIFRQ